VERKLGITWNSELDEFSFKLKVCPEASTKRQILSVVMSVFDFCHLSFLWPRFCFKTSGGKRNSAGTIQSPPHYNSGDEIGPERWLLYDNSKFRVALGMADLVSQVLTTFSFIFFVMPLNNDMAAPSISVTMRTTLTMSHSTPPKSLLPRSVPTRSQSLNCQLLA